MFLRAITLQASLIGSQLMTFILSTYATHLVLLLIVLMSVWFYFLFYFVLIFCASCFLQAEMSLVLDHGVPPENIILSSVFKQLAHIKYAAKNNIQHLVCENEAELSKIARLHPDAK